MTCRVQVTSSDGGVTQARALLDCAASTFLMTERLAQQRLLRRSWNFTLNGVDGLNVHPKEQFQSGRSARWGEAD